MVLDLLDQWHIQCVRDHLDSDADVRDYIQGANLFVRRIWSPKGSPSVTSPTLPKLQVAKVENDTTVYRGATSNVVKIKFKLDIMNPNDNTINASFRHFCTRVFDLMADGEIQSKISAITDNSLLGIEPLSQLFRLHWTQSFLATFVNTQTPLLRSLARANVSTAWLRGIAVVMVATQTGEKQQDTLMRHIWAGLTGNLMPETKMPDQRRVDECDAKMKKFALKAEDLVRYMDECSQQCDIQRAAGRDKLPSDYDIGLLDHVLEVLTLAFDVLTINATIYEEWCKIVASTEAKVQVAGVISGCSAASLALGVGIKMGATATGSAGVAAAGAGAAATGAGAAAGATTASGFGATMFTSAAVVGPLALFVVAAGLFAVHYHFQSKAHEQVEVRKKMSEMVAVLYRQLQSLAQWTVASSTGPPADDEGQEMQEVRANLHQMGLDEAYTMADFQATLDSEREVIKKSLEKMKKDPSCASIFG